jgi:hypothetical protein
MNHRRGGRWWYGIAALVLTSGAEAAVTPEAAKALGSTLTPAGAEAAGNADGRIPPWRGREGFEGQQFTLRHAELESLKAEGDASVLAAMRPAGLSETPLFTITRDNLERHADTLSAGHRKLFERNPSYRMPVYAGARHAFLPPAVDAATRDNATRAELVGTDQLRGARLGIPFPLPQTGAEVIWNHKLKFRGAAVRRFNNEVIVEADGSFQLARIIEDVKLKYGHPTQPSAIEEGLILYYLQEVISPRRIAGQMLLVHETTDQTSGGRNAWLFNPGMGRTRRAPNVGYDNPKVSADGLMFNDQTDMFNGALDRYQWNLVGKREMLIPYNALHMIKPSATYEALVAKGHLNPDFTRYELHRVWVVEATLKPGLRHSFRRRVFYVDEDSWSIALVDNYDDRGELWRFQEAHLSTFPFVPATTGSPEVHYDLHSGRYFVTASFAGDSYPDFNQDFEDSYFRSQALGSRSLRR